MPDRKEYIERGALEEKLNRRLKQLRKEYGNNDHYTDGFDEAVIFVEDEPSATDVAEVVRCGECMHNECGDCVHPNNVSHSYDCDWNCYDHHLSVSDEHFCSYGEKKDDADNGKNKE